MSKINQFSLHVGHYYAPPPQVCCIACINHAHRVNDILQRITDRQIDYIINNAWVNSIFIQQTKQYTLAKMNKLLIIDKNKTKLNSPRKGNLRGGGRLRLVKHTTYNMAHYTNMFNRQSLYIAGHPLPACYLVCTPFKVVQ